MEFEEFEIGNLDEILEKSNKEIEEMAKTLNEQAKEIIELAEESGVRSNFFFRTTFQRYLVQVDNASKIEKELKKTSELTVTKSYQKNRDNVYVNPLIPEYNKTTDSANKTVNTLLKIIREFKVGDGEEETEDPLIKLINGGDDHDESEDD